jgi:hypothetical protein
MKKINTYKIDISLLAKSLGLSESQAFDFINDGRIMGRLGEFTHSSLHGGIREKENSSFDITESGMTKTEIRSITKNVSFASSKEVGYGRKVTEEGFQKKLNSLDNFVLLDLRNLNNGEYTSIQVDKNDLKVLELRKNKSISAKKFFEIYDKIK